MNVPHSAPRNPLLAKEDWWAIWLGTLLIAGVATSLVTSVPGVGRWSASPVEGFAGGRSLGLLALGLGLVNLDKETVVLGGLLGVGPDGVTLASLRIAYDLRDARALFR